MSRVQHFDSDPAGRGGERVFDLHGAWVVDPAVPQAAWDDAEWRRRLS